MTLKNRRELKAKFMNGLRPSEDDFYDVIGSTLNKREDQFFGKWRPGTVYREGDVVIHKRTLWVFKADQELCSHAPPEMGEYWQSLIVPMGDEDWFILGDPDDPGPDPLLMVAHDKVDCVGIGTFEPQAKLDVLDADKSRFLLGPKAAASTTFTLVNLKSGEDKTYLLTGLDADYASWMSDGPGGFAFLHGDPCDDGDEDQLDYRDGDLMMVIQPDTGGLVRVGMGTDKPAAMLDITDARKGQFLFNPEDKQDPAFTIVNLDEGGDHNYLASGVGATTSVFVTDAPEGFVFKQGKEYGAFTNEENINQGETLVCIAPTGKMGVGMEPESYQVDVNGMIRAYTLYLDTDRGNLARPANLGEGLDLIKRLRPVRFTWLKATGFLGEGEQIGLIAQEVEAVIPQVVKTNSDGTKAVAYPNLVAVVVKAVQEQQTLIEKMHQGLTAAEAVNRQLQEAINQQEAINARQQGEIDAQQRTNEAQQQAIDAQQDVNKQQQQELDALGGRLAQQEQVNTEQQKQIDEILQRLR